MIKTYKIDTPGNSHDVDADTYRIDPGGTLTLIEMRGMNEMPRRSYAPGTWTFIKERIEEAT